MPRSISFCRYRVIPTFAAIPSRVPSGLPGSARRKSIWIWPISPAFLLRPVWIFPSMMTAPPTPVPTHTATIVEAPRPAPSRASARAARRTSCPRRRRAFGNAPASAFTMSQFFTARFPARIITPFSASTAPGAATASALTRSREAPASFSARSEASTSASVSAAASLSNGVLSLPRPTIFPAPSTAPARIFVPPRSIPSVI